MKLFALGIEAASFFDFAVEVVALKRLLGQKTFLGFIHFLGKKKRYSGKPARNFLIEGNAQKKILKFYIENRTNSTGFRIWFFIFRPQNFDYENYRTGGGLTRRDEKK